MSTHCSPRLEPKAATLPVSGTSITIPGRTVPEHRAFLVLDAEDSSGRLDPDLLALRAALYRAVDAALRRAGIAEADVQSEDRGDGVLLVFGRMVSEAALAGPLLDHLRSELERHNIDAELEDWLRLRVAVSHGQLARDPHGWSGEALTRTFRLANAATVKRSLRDAGRAQCVVVCSDDFFDGVVKHDRATHPETYRKVQLQVDKTEAPAWIRVPGYRQPPLLAPTPGLPTSTGSGVTTVFNRRVDVRRDLNIGSRPESGS